jgi:hypothetical protein
LRKIHEESFDHKTMGIDNIQARTMVVQAMVRAMVQAMVQAMVRVRVYLTILCSAADER